MPIFSAVAGSRLAAPWLEQDCALCGARTHTLVCRECREALPRSFQACTRCALPLEVPGVCGECLRHPPGFDEAHAAFEYRFPVDRLVRRFKYAGDLALGRWLAGALAERVASGPRPALVVAPPSAVDRLRSRGFNPALEIAKSLAARIGCACALGGLARAKRTAAQPGLGREERRRNLAGAFACAAEVRGLHVALVDDVLTTGATADAAARALKEAGAARVSAWIVARTPDPHV